MFEKLTEREINIVKLLCLNQKSIALKLGLKLSTIHSYIPRIYQKLMATNPQTALIKAIQNKIVDIDEIEIE